MRTEISRACLNDCVAHAHACMSVFSCSCACALVCVRACCSACRSILRVIDVCLLLDLVKNMKSAPVTDLLWYKK